MMDNESKHITDSIANVLFVIVLLVAFGVFVFFFVISLNAHTEEMTYEITEVSYVIKADNTHDRYYIVDYLDENGNAAEERIEESLFPQNPSVESTKHSPQYMEKTWIEYPLFGGKVKTTLHINRDLVHRVNDIGSNDVGSGTEEDSDDSCMCEHCGTESQ